MLLRVIQSEADAAGRVDWSGVGRFLDRAGASALGHRHLADKAYSLRAIRAHLRARGIGSVIPEPMT